MDKPSANFDMSVASMVEKLHTTPLIVQVPIGSGASFEGIADVVSMDKCIWDMDSNEGRQFHKSPIDPQQDALLYEQVIEVRSKLIEQLADLDDSIAECILNDEEYESIPLNSIHNAIRKATLDMKGVPILCGSSFKNKGVQPLLNAVIKYLPNPADIHHPFIKYYPDELCGLAFKLVHDKHHGPLTFVRLYGGAIQTGHAVYNINRECSEKVTRLFQVYADEHKDITEAQSGNIIAVAGLKEVIIVH